MKGVTNWIVAALPSAMCFTATKAQTVDSSRTSERATCTSGRCARSSARPRPGQKRASTKTRCEALRAQITCSDA